MNVLLDKVRSRKFFITIAFGFVALIGDELGLDIDPEVIERVGYAVMAYVLGQGAVDFMGARAKNGG